MKGNSLGTFAKYYDKIYLNMKDYQKEVTIVKDVISQFEKKPSRTLLDVGCGTGEHLKYLSSHFRCTGIDINRHMIEIAKSKVPSAKFKVADMINLRLQEKFDVILCMFSSIGYVQSFNNLVKTLENFNKHLNEKGLVIVEPWVFKKDFKKNHVGLDIYKDEKIKLARMSTSKLTKSGWLVFFHYLHGEKGEISYTNEIHKMLACDCEDYIKAFELAGFKDTKYLTDNLWDRCRGLFIVIK